MNPPFAVLGIPSTKDIGEIRRAYAARLKETNPEDDADGFQQLRRAYEAALGWARRSTSEAQADSEPQQAVPPDPALETLSPTTPIDPPSNPLADLQAAADRLEVALRKADQGASQADEKEVLGALQALLSRPEQENVALRDQTERWIGELILARRPNADILIEPATEFFGWAGQQTRLDSSPLVMAVLRRHATVNRLAEMRRPGSAYSRGYKLLKQPTPVGLHGKLLTFWGRQEADKTLALIDKLPDLASEFDPGTLRAWSRGRKSVSVTPKSVKLWNGFVWFYRRILFFGLLAGLFLTVASQLTQHFPRAYSEIDSAKGLADLAYSCRTMARAETFKDDGSCDAVSKVSPNSLQTLGDLGLVKLRLGEPGLALNAFDKVLAVSPGDARALYGDGLARIALKRSGGLEQIDEATAANFTIGAAFQQYGFPIPTGVVAASHPPVVVTPKSPPRAASAVYKPASWLRRPATTFPKLAAHYGVHDGQVTLNCGMNSDGAPKDCMVVSEDPQDYGFADAAMAAEQSAAFELPTLNGQAVAGSRVSVPFVFSTSPTT